CASGTPPSTLKRSTGQGAGPPNPHVCGHGVPAVAGAGVPFGGFAAGIGTTGCGVPPAPPSSMSATCTAKRTSLTEGVSTTEAGFFHCGRVPGGHPAVYVNVSVEGGGRPP